MVQIVLLGQFGVSGKLTGDIYNSNDKKKMLLQVQQQQDDETESSAPPLLWLVPQQPAVGGDKQQQQQLPQQQQQLPLLQSTSSLMRFLRHDIPGQDENAAVEEEDVVHAQAVGSAEATSDDDDGRPKAKDDDEDGMLVEDEDKDNKGPMEEDDVSEGDDDPMEEEEEKSDGDEDKKQEAEAKEGKNKKSKKGGPSAPAQPIISPQDEPFQALHRNMNMVDVILRALGHIRDLKRDAPKQETEQKLWGGPRPKNYHERRLRAMQHQRDRLQERLNSNSTATGENEQQQQQQQSSDGSNIVVGDVADDDDEMMMVDEDEDHNQQQHQEEQRRQCSEEETKAWIQLATVLNSLSILTPILLPILSHARRNDTSLVIQNIRITGRRERRKGACCWLLGQYTFDWCRVQKRNKIHDLVMELWDSLVGGIGSPMLSLNEATLSREWKAAMRQLMHFVAQEQHSRQQAGVVSATSTPPASPTQQSLLHPPVTNGWKQNAADHPFQHFESEERAVAEQLSHALDEKFGVKEEKDADEHRQYLAAVNGLHAHISQLVRQVYPDARLSIYGSCLSDLSLGKSSDVDLSIYIEHAQRNKEAFENGRIVAKKYEREMKNTVYKVCRKLEGRTHEFHSMNPITRARVPVVCGTYIKANNPHSADGSMAFDICFLNDIAVANSSLLREYSLVDPRAKQLIMLVKRWAKGNQISSAKDSTLSSYTWTNLVVFYLQCLGFVPNLQSPKLMDEVGIPELSESKDRWHSINNLDTRYARWEQAKEFWTRPDELASLSVTALLYGFFSFYASRFRSNLFLISVKRGGARQDLLPKTVFPKCSAGLVIEDPFETYDSHCPHDLSVHANGGGMQKILKCLKQAEQFLGQVFRANDMASVASLWPVISSTVAMDGGAPAQKPARQSNQQQRKKKNPKSDGTKQKQQQNAPPEQKKGEPKSVPPPAGETAATEATASGNAKPTQHQKKHHHHHQHGKHKNQVKDASKMTTKTENMNTAAEDTGQKLSSEDAVTSQQQQQAHPTFNGEGAEGKPDDSKSKQQGKRRRRGGKGGRGGGGRGRGGGGRGRGGRTGKQTQNGPASDKAAAAPASSAAAPVTEKN